MICQGWKTIIKKIAPINEQLKKEIEAYDQIKYIHVAVVKSRIIELINTVSQLSNVKFILHLENEIHCVKIKEIDLFTIINILIDNAVEEVETQEEGEIEIEMGYNEKIFIFQIKNTLNGLKSTPKPENTHKGLEIVKEILRKYSPYVRFNIDDRFGYYKTTLEVRND